MVYWLRTTANNSAKHHAVRGRTVVRYEQCSCGISMNEPSRVRRAEGVCTCLCDQSWCLILQALWVQIVRLGLESWSCCLLWLSIWCAPPWFPTPAATQSSTSGSMNDLILAVAVGGMLSQRWMGSQLSCYSSSNLVLVAIDCTLKVQIYGEESWRTKIFGFSKQSILLKSKTVLYGRLRTLSQCLLSTKIPPLQLWWLHP